MKTELTEKKINLCTRCGKCVSECPTFKVYKNEVFSPRGRLFLFSQGKSHLSFHLCLFCERCREVCPHQISFPEVYIEKLKEKDIPFFENISSIIGENPLLYFLKINNYLHLVDLKKTQQIEIEYGKGDIVVYNSCGLNTLYPQALKKFEGYLKKRGISIGIPWGTVCCGAIFLNLGLISQLKKNALRNLEILEKTEGPIIMFCATCLWMFKRIYVQIFKNTPYEKRFLELSPRVISAYRYFYLELEEEFKILKEKVLGENILFHLPCHLTEEFNLVKKNIEVVDFCCGSTKLFPLLRGFQKENKKEWIKNLQNKNILATYCTGCYLNFNFLLKKPPMVYHWFELL